MNKFIGVAAVALAMASAPAYATTFTQLDQGALDTLGTSNFGAIIDSEGAFDQTFTFTTAAARLASASVISIMLGGGWDVDFTAITLDGVAFAQQTGDPAESWALTSALLGAGGHTLRLLGNVTSTPQSEGVSYGGTLNVAAAGMPGGVPEPAAWAMMIMGFGGMGALMRRRRTRLAPQLA